MVEGFQVRIENSWCEVWCGVVLWWWWVGFRLGRALEMVIGFGREEDIRDLGMGKFFTL